MQLTMTMQLETGLIILNIISGQLQKKARLEVLLDEGYWPVFSTVRAQSNQVQWDHTGEGFIKELDFGKVWVRLNENDEGEKDSIVAQYKFDSKPFLERCLVCVVSSATDS